jgi:hypothetical protein
MFSRTTSVILRLLIVLAALTITSSVAKAQVEFVGVNKKATLTSNSTVAIVTGSVVCTGTFSVSAIIQQNHSGTNVVGSGSTPGTGTELCTGTPQSFAVQVQVLNPPNATFSKGPASAIVQVNDPLGSQTVTTEVQLTE